VFTPDDSSTLFETKAAFDKRVCSHSIKAQEKTQATNTNACSIFDSDTATNLLRVYVDFANFLLDFCHLSQTNEEWLPGVMIVFYLYFNIYFFSFLITKNKTFFIYIIRLDRLLTLLSNGDSLAVKRSAATQIGQVVNTYPKEVEPILNKVHKRDRIILSKKISFLFKLKRHVIHSSWDVRIACGLAIELISQNISNDFSRMNLILFF
jgi:hypothetical protein